MNIFVRARRLILSIMILVLALPVWAKDIEIATGFSIPPYFFPESNTGIQFEILSEAFKLSGVTLKLHYASNKRILLMLQAGQVDGMVNAPPNIPNVFYSNAIIDFQNGAIALKKNALKIRSVADLSNVSVVAFQNASNFLGADFAQMSKTNLQYDEIVYQLSQLYLLYYERCDVIVMDKRIFSHFQNLHREKMGFDQAVVFYDILPRSPRYAAFLSEQLRDWFNAGLLQLKASERYQEIINKYEGQDVWR